MQRIIGVLLLAFFGASALAESDVRYVSDEITIVLRDTIMLPE